MNNEVRSRMTIRNLQTIRELESVRELEALVWSAKESVPSTQTSAAIKNGGFILGAFLDDKLIGFQYSFPGYDGKHIYLYSHSLGIHPDYRRMGVGERLKRAQKETAIQKGYDLITWTFDPLETVNGYLNLHKLAGTCSVYIEDAYGDIPDGLNAGIPSDRFLVEWSIKKPQTSQMKIAVHEQVSVIETTDQDGWLIPEKIALRHDEDQLLVPVPGNFQQLKQTNLSLALLWRETTRQVFTHYLSYGWTVTDLIKDPQHQQQFFYLIDKGTS